MSDREHLIQRQQTYIFERELESLWKIPHYFIVSKSRTQHWDWWRVNCETSRAMLLSFYSFCAEGVSLATGEQTERPEIHKICIFSQRFVLMGGVCLHTCGNDLFSPMTVITGCQPCFYWSWWLISFSDMVKSWWLDWHTWAHTPIDTHDT